MGRKDTFKNSSSLEGSFLSDKLNMETFDDSLKKVPDEEKAKPKEIIVEKDPVETLDLSDLPTIEELPTKDVKQVKTSSKFNRSTIFSKPETINKTFVLNKDIADALESIVMDKKTKKKIPGTKGLLSKVINNALIKELIELGVLESDALDNIQDY